MAAAGGSSRQMNHPTTARIPEGALVERAVSLDLKQMHTVTVVLNDADFHTAERMAIGNRPGGWFAAGACRR